MNAKVSEHLATAQQLLEAADRRYADGDRIGASEELWQAAVHAIQAGARHHGWDCDGSNDSLRAVAERLSIEHNNDMIGTAYSVSINFRDNSNKKSGLYDYMEDFDFEFSRPIVWRLLERVRQAMEMD